MKVATPATLALAAASMLLSACGSSGSTSPSASASASASAASSASASGTPASKAAGIALTAAAFPSGGPALTQASDGLLNNVPNTVQRVFANSDNSFRVEDDLIIDTSATQAQTNYPALRDAAKKNVATVTSTVKPAGLGANADEYVGTAANGHSIVAIAWLNGSVLAAVLVESTTNPVDQGFAEATAKVQNDLITNAGLH